MSLSLTHQMRKPLRSTESYRVRARGVLTPRCEKAAPAAAKRAPARKPRAKACAKKPKLAPRLPDASDEEGAHAPPAPASALVDSSDDAPKDSSDDEV